MEKTKTFFTAILSLFMLICFAGTSASAASPTNLRLINNKTPDLKVRFTAPKSVVPGTDISSQIKLKVYNSGSSPAPGTISAGRNGYMVDMVLSTDTNVPMTFAPYSPNFLEDVLVKGGRVSRTYTLRPGHSKFYPVGVTIPKNVPSNSCYLCAIVDPGNKIKESNENNNVYCKKIYYKTNNSSNAKKPDLGMYGFLRIGEKKRQVKWNGTIYLRPEDAFLTSNGIPAFNIYYSYREYQNVSSGGHFKNKIFFRGKLVSQQTNLSLGPKQIKNVHTQAYLIPRSGKLQIKIDADNDIDETRENNNFHFFVNVQFRGF